MCAPVLDRAPKSRYTPIRAETYIALQRNWCYDAVIKWA